MFKISASGPLTSLHPFGFNDGAYPLADAAAKGNQKSQDALEEFAALSAKL